MAEAAKRKRRRRRRRRMGKSKKARYDAKYLPRNLMVEILLRLPTKYVARFRCVCKLWNSAINDPSFADEHHRRRAAVHKSIIVLNRRRTYINSPMISRLDFEGEIFDRLTMPDFEHGDYCSSNSASGLICLCGWRPGTNSYLLNPTTREYVMLPKNSLPSYVETVGLGFSSNYKITRQYKVARQLSNPGKRTVDWQILTLGADEEWRSIKQFPPGFDYLIFQRPPVFLHGALHWTSMYDYNDRDVIMFDVERETFVCFGCPVPLDFELLGPIELNSHLAVVSMSDTSGLVEIWKLEDDANKIWSKKYSVYPLPSWIYDEDFFPYTVVGLHDGNFLVRLEGSGDLICYNLLKETTTDLTYGCNEQSMFLYTESLVSPKMLSIVEKDNAS